MSPAAGFSNGTVVTVSGYGVWREGALCRFGAALVNATRHLSSDAVKCAAPPAALSGAWSRVALTFSEPWSSSLYGFEASLRGIARVHNGTLRLVDKHEEGNNPVGSSDWNAVGSIVLALPQPALPPVRFKATFRLRMGGGDGADGISFSYGDLAQGNIGELGSGNGLRVCFRTLSLQRVEIWYANSLLHTSSPPPATRYAPTPSRTSSSSTAPQASTWGTMASRTPTASSFQAGRQRTDGASPLARAPEQSATTTTLTMSSSRGVRL